MVKKLIETIRSKYFWKGFWDGFFLVNPSLIGLTVKQFLFVEFVLNYLCMLLISYSFYRMGMDNGSIAVVAIADHAVFLVADSYLFIIGVVMSYIGFYEENERSSMLFHCPYFGMVIYWIGAKLIMTSVISLWYGVFIWW